MGRCKSINNIWLSNKKGAIIAASIVVTKDIVKNKIVGVVSTSVIKSVFNYLYMMKVINGLFCAQKLTGVQRFAHELIKELDLISKPSEYTLVIPQYLNEVPKLKNIAIIKYGNSKGFLWEQWDLFRFLTKKKCVLVSLCNSQPILHPGVMCIHDVAYKTHPEYFKTRYGRLSAIWHRFVFKQAVCSKYHIFTVSYFSKYSIIDTYKIKNKSRISVLGNGWQHIISIVPDYLVLQKCNLNRWDFYFTLGNINYNKNVRWILDYARKHPEQNFVISGRKVKNSEISLENISNVKWLGYLSDEEIVALYRCCKAFIFPSIHEGFGIPPLEALCLGAKVVVANTSCLPEIFQGSVYYIDPYNTDINIDDLIENEQIAPPELVLNRYSWKNIALCFKQRMDL